MSFISKYLLKHKIMKVFILFSFIFSMNANAKSIGDLLTSLQETSASAQYVYFAVGSDTFLSRKEGNSYAVWLYTLDRKWKPISNAAAFDGFAKANNIFSSISINKKNASISFGNIIGTGALAESNFLKNKTFTLGWYFWMKNGDAFLLKPVKNDEVSIWNYTGDRKWKPVYNAPAFDNFPEKPKTFTNVSFDTKTFGIIVGAIEPLYNVKLNVVLPYETFPPFDATKDHYNKGDKISYNDGVCTANWWINQSPAINSAAWSCVSSSTDNSPKPYDPNKDHYNKGDKILYDGGTCTANWWINQSPATNSDAWSCVGTTGGDNGNAGGDNGNAGGDNGNAKEIKAYDPNHGPDGNKHYNKGEKVLYNGGVCEAKWWINMSPTEYSSAWSCIGGTSNGGTDNNGTSNGGTSNGGTDNNGTSNGGTDNNGTITYPDPVAYDDTHCSQLNAKCRVENAVPHYERGEKILYNGGVCTANFWTNVSPAVNTSYSRSTWTCTGGNNNNNANSDGITDDLSYEQGSDFTGTVPDTSTFFMPFADVISWPPYKMADGVKAGIKNFALGFINSAGGQCSPRWGNYPGYIMNNPTLNLPAQIKTVMNGGGKVMLSFGGAAAGADELAKVCKTPAELATAYKEAVDKTGVKMIDFDIEGGNSFNKETVTKRMRALKIFQTSNPDIGISFTLATMPYGLLKPSGLMIVETAVKEGVEFDFINLMIMDYGEAFPANIPGKHRMADYGIQALKSVNKQLKHAIEGERKNGRFTKDSNGEYYNRLGATPMIGRNDTLNEYFYRSDIVKLRKFADATGVKMLSMWSLNRDKPLKPGGNPKASLATDTKLSKGNKLNEYGLGDKYEFSKLLQRK